MNRITKSLVLAGTALVLVSGTDLMAQRGGGGRGGNFDPEQFRQQQMDNYRETLGVASDDEWKIIQGRIEKVMTARQEYQPFNNTGFGRGFGRGGRRGGGGGGGGRRGGGLFGGEPNPVVTALQDAVESGASADDLKAKMAKWREEKKAKEEALAKAQDSLKEVLSVKQEAAAITMGLVR